MSLPHTLFRPIFLLLAFSLGAMTNASAQTRDVAGSKDYPGIGRFGGSVITGYQVKDFDAARMQGAAFKDGKPADARRLEGRITRIAYRTNPGPSILEVSRNFETQLAKAGFETLLACDVDACGGIPFSESIDALPIPQMWVDGFNYRYFAGRKVDGGRETYASIIVSENNREIYTQLVVAELGAIENKMVDAAAMAKGASEPVEPQHETVSFEPESIPKFDLDFQLDEPAAGLKPTIAPAPKPVAPATARAPELAMAGSGAPAPQLARPAAAIELDKLDLAFDPARSTFEDPTPSVLDGQWHDAATKLDLAKAYQEMGDVEGAREILQEVLHEGDDQQKSEAQALMAKLA
jgi:FimV-like protein